MQNLALKSSKGIKPIHAILFIAAMLRLPYVFLTSYTHDELSALFRINVNSFLDLFSTSGLTDAHPPLVQVFLYFYTSLFGDTEWIVKLPFAIAGIASVWFVYKIGQKFYNETAGLFASGIMAVSQLFIFHSITARPYAPALLFTVAFAYYWLNNFVANEKSIKNQVYYVLFAWLGFATHHISTLTIFLIIITGLLIIHKHQWKQYIKLNGILLILALPLLYVINFQLQFKGIGSWLGPPEKNYLLSFFGYLFHYNNIYIISVIVFLLVGIYLIFKKGFPSDKKHVLLFSVVFILVYLITYAYSVYIAPMLQFSLLQFALPLFLLGIFSLFHQFSKSFSLRILIVVLFLGIFSLFTTRKTQEYFMDFPYRSLAEFCEPSLNTNTKTLVVTGDRFEFVNRYLKESKNFKIISVNNLDKPWDKIRNEIEKFNPTKVISANCDFTTYSLIRSYFPVCEKSKEGFLNNFFICAKGRFNKTHTKSIVFTELNKSSRIQLDSLNEFCILMDTPVAKLNLGSYLQYEFTGTAISNEKEPFVLVMEFLQGDSSLLWHGNQIFVKPNTNSLEAVYATFDMHYELRKFDTEKIRVKFSLWNVKKVKSEITNMQLLFHEPNYKMYGAIEDIK